MDVLRETWRVFFFQAEDGIRDGTVTGVQTCALPISREPPGSTQCAEALYNRTNHAAGWSLSVWPPFACEYAVYWRDLNDPTGTQYWDNELWTHSVVGTGSQAGTFTRLWSSPGSYYFANLNQPAGLDPNGFVNQKAVLTAAMLPQFSGYAAFNYTQSYVNLTAATSIAEPINRKMIDNRALNTYSGINAEDFSKGNCLTSSMTLTLQSGTTQTYL